MNAFSPDREIGFMAFFMEEICFDQNLEALKN